MLLGSIFQSRHCSLFSFPTSAALYNKVCLANNNMAPAAIDLPSSYATLATTQVAVAHVPPSSPAATAVLLVALNRPSNYNAFAKTMEEELVRVYSMFDVDGRVKCVVLNNLPRRCGPRRWL